MYKERVGETSTVEFEGIKPGAKKLFIVPYYEKNISYEEQLKSISGLTRQFYSIDDKKGFNYKNEGKINVYNVKTSNDSIKIYYTIEGKIPAMQHLPYVALSEKGNNGFKEITLNNVVLSVLDLKKLNNFCVEFTKIDPTKEHKYGFPLYINTEVVKGDVIKVNLK
jgi:hypothetical protein